MAKNTKNETLLAKTVKLHTKADNSNKVEKQKLNAVESIKKQLSKHGLTLADLQIGKVKVAKPTKVGVKEVEKVGKATKVSTKATKLTNVGGAEVPVKQVVSRRKPEPKFLDPKTGATWTGRGKTPKWMAAAIMKGKSRDKFAIR